MGNIISCIKNDNSLSYIKEKENGYLEDSEIIKCTNIHGSIRYYTRSRKNSYGNMNDK